MFLKRYELFQEHLSIMLNKLIENLFPTSIALLFFLYSVYISSLSFFMERIDKWIGKGWGLPCESSHTGTLVQ